MSFIIAFFMLDFQHLFKPPAAAMGYSDYWACFFATEQHDNFYLFRLEKESLVSGL